MCSVELPYVWTSSQKASLAATISQLTCKYEFTVTHLKWKLCAVSEMITVRQTIPIKKHPTLFSNSSAHCTCIDQPYYSMAVKV